jgi:endonuclease/exonuclease/phosphatase family metal-dependent hydrolase
VPEITVLQWNVESGEKFENICSYLDTHRADVACLQELTIGLAAHSGRHGPRFIAGELGYQCCFVELPNIAPDGSGITLANAILVNGEIERSRSAVLSQPGEQLGFENQSRGYIEASVTVHGTRFTVATTHLGYSRAFEMSARRKQEARQLLAEIPVGAARFVLAGDFNAEPGSYVISEVSRVMRPAGPDYDQPTWTTRPFSYQGFTADELRWRLDYVFVSADVAVARAEILRSPYSDHLPVLCRLDMPRVSAVGRSSGARPR